MRRSERGADLDRYLERVPRLQSAARQRRSQCFALDQLAGDVVHAVRFADVVDGDDVRMIQRQHGTRLLEEAIYMLRITNKSRSQHLERHLASHLVGGQVDLPHASAAQESVDGVLRNLRYVRRIVREEQRRDVGGRTFDEVAGLLVGGDQRLYLGAQIRIVRACLVKK